MQRSYTQHDSFQTHTRKHTQTHTHTHTHTCKTDHKTFNEASREKMVSSCNTKIDSLICVTWLSHMCDMKFKVTLNRVSSSNTKIDSLACVTRLTYLCDMTLSYVWHDSLICMCDMTQSYPWHDSRTLIQYHKKIIPKKKDLDCSFEGKHSVVIQYKNSKLSDTKKERLFQKKIIRSKKNILHKKNKHAIKKKEPWL